MEDISKVRIKPETLAKLMEVIKDTLVKDDESPACPAIVRLNYTKKHQKRNYYEVFKPTDELLEELSKLAQE